MNVLTAYRPAFLANVPVFVQAIALGIIALVAYIAYSLLTEEKPLKGFPVVSLSERGLSPKSSWLWAGTELVAKGLKEHNAPFQVITGTGPKVGPSI